MKISLNILILLCGLLTANSQSSELEKVSSEKSATVSFEIIGFNHYRKLTLLKNDEFVRTEIVVSCYGGGSEIKEYYGKYERNDSILILRPNYVELKAYSQNGSKRNDKIEYGSDSLKISTEFKIIKHNGNQFLVPLEYSRLTDSQIKLNEKKIQKLFFNRQL